MKSKTCYLVLMVFSASILFVGYGNAATKPRDACKDDIAAFCQGVSHGEGRIIKCLRDHADQLSPSCREGLENLKERQGMKQGKGAPAKDAGKE
ncbi:MAG TPA: cysteine rich repeat-containing protein [Syntrophorhabdaceae bacterium]|jgi:hypothetical protein